MKLLFLAYIKDAAQSVKRICEEIFIEAHYSVLTELLRIAALKVNRPLEGLNNKIKRIKCQAYGFRDMQYFKLRLYDMHTSKYSFA